MSLEWRKAIAICGDFLALIIVAVACLIVSGFLTWQAGLICWLAGIILLFAGRRALSKSDHSQGGEDRAYTTEEAHLNEGDYDCT